MRRYGSAYRVRLDPVTQERLAALCGALHRSEAEVIRKLLQVALTAPAPVLEGAGLTPQRDAAR